MNSGVQQPPHPVRQLVFLPRYNLNDTPSVK